MISKKIDDFPLRPEFIKVTFSSSAGRLSLTLRWKLTLIFLPALSLTHVTFRSRYPPSQDLLQGPQSSTSQRAGQACLLQGAIRDCGLLPTSQRLSSTSTWVLLLMQTDRAIIWPPPQGDEQWDSGFSFQWNVMEEHPEKLSPPQTPQASICFVDPIFKSQPTLCEKNKSKLSSSFGNCSRFDVTQGLPTSHSPSMHISNESFLHLVPSTTLSSIFTINPGFPEDTHVKEQGASGSTVASHKK